MILVDTELARREDEGNPVRVGLVGAGRIARTAAVQILNSTPGMRLAGIANRTTARASAIWAENDREVRIVETLDGIGGFCAYGVCENAWVSTPERLLPIGLSAGCILTRDVAKDQAITLDDVTFPEGRLIDRLRAEQNAAFPMPTC